MHPLNPLPYSGSLESAALSALLLAPSAPLVNPPPTPHDLRAVVVVLTVALATALLVGLGVVVVGALIVGSMSLDRARTMSRLTAGSADVGAGDALLDGNADRDGIDAKGGSKQLSRGGEHARRRRTGMDPDEKDMLQSRENSVDGTSWTRIHPHAHPLDSYEKGFNADALVSIPGDG